MKLTMINLLKKIEEKGVIESMVLCLWTVISKIVSILKVSLFCFRGYSISLSVAIGRGSNFFESRKGAICIGRGSQIGNRVRLKAGFYGKIDIGANVLVDDDCYISSHGKITIGDETMVASHVYIVDFNHKLPLSQSKKNIGRKEGYRTKDISIGKYVWIGTHAVILPGVTIGDNAVVGAGAIVTKSVPANCIVAGNPARIIKQIR